MASSTRASAERFSAGGGLEAGTRSKATVTSTRHPVPSWPASGSCRSSSASVRKRFTHKGSRLRLITSTKALGRSGRSTSRFPRRPSTMARTRLTSPSLRMTGGHPLAAAKRSAQTRYTSLASPCAWPNTCSGDLKSTVPLGSSCGQARARTPPAWLHRSSSGEVPRSRSPVSARRGSMSASPNEGTPSSESAPPFFSSTRSTSPNRTTGFEGADGSDGWGRAGTAGTGASGAPDSGPPPTHRLNHAKRMAGSVPQSPERHPTGQGSRIAPGRASLQAERLRLGALHVTRPMLRRSLREPRTRRRPARWRRSRDRQPLVAPTRLVPSPHSLEAEPSREDAVAFVVVGSTEQRRAGARERPRPPQARCNQRWLRAPSATASTWRSSTTPRAASSSRR